MNEKEIIIKFLKNIVERLVCLNTRLEKLETMLHTGFRATGEAFYETKTCVIALCALQEDTADNLSQCSGAIQDNTWRL